MSYKERVLGVIYQAIDELNGQLEEDLVQAPETALYGQEGPLDSLELVNLIVATEEYLDDEFDVVLTLADEKAMSQKQSPFRTVDSLADYICSLLEVHHA